MPRPLFPAICILPTLALAGCIATAAAEDPTLAAPADASPAEGPAPAPAAKLPDYTQQLVKGKCNNGPGGAGADSYYTGEITIDGGGFTGVERWHIFKNTKWRALEAKDCVVTYKMSGKVTDVKDCGSCDVALHGVADVDFEQTTCHVNLYSERGTRRWVVDYALDRKKGGDLMVHFNNGGQPQYAGQHAGDRAVYMSKHRCLWF